MAFIPLFAPPLPPPPAQRTIDHHTHSPPTSSRTHNGRQFTCSAPDLHFGLTSSDLTVGIFGCASRHFLCFHSAWRSSPLIGALRRDVGIIDWKPCWPFLCVVFFCLWCVFSFDNHFFSLKIVLTYFFFFHLVFCFLFCCIGSLRLVTVVCFFFFFFFVSGRVLHFFLSFFCFYLFIFCGTCYHNRDFAAALVTLHQSDLRIPRGLYVSLVLGGGPAPSFPLISCKSCMQQLYAIFFIFFSPGVCRRLPLYCILRTFSIGSFAFILISPSLVNVTSLRLLVECRWRSEFFSPRFFLSPPRWVEYSLYMLFPIIASRILGVLLDYRSHLRGINIARVIRGPM